MSTSTTSNTSRPDLSQNQPPQSDTSFDEVSRSNTNMNETSGDKAGLDDDGYPPQLHAGKVGYGPEYNKSAGFADKMTGLKEEVKGKLTKNPDLVEQGKKRRNNELGKDDDVNPFVKADEEKAAREGKQQDGDANATSTQPQPNTSTTQKQTEAGLTNIPQGNMPTEKGAKEEAATVAPQGTEEGTAQAREGTKTA